MNRLLGLLGMTVGGWIGWALGSIVSLFTAFMLGVVGTGFGLWVARRAAQRLLP